MEVGGAWQYENSIVLLYYEKRIVDGKSVYEAYFAAFDSHSPARLLWRLDEMVWNSQEEWAGLDVVALGAAQVDDKIVSYWHVDGRITYAVVLSGLHFSRGKLFAPEYQLARHMDNPLISPHDTNEWETFTTFNPAACVIDGRVHILYRAQGYDYISSIGYATHVMVSSLKIDTIVPSIRQLPILKKTPQDKLMRVWCLAVDMAGAKTLASA
jgi:predicted GH43/DUF377 family glycosyl hydrolase